MCDRLWLYALEVHVVESVVGVASARQCDVGADELDVFCGEDCRETVATNLANED